MADKYEGISYEDWVALNYDVDWDYPFETDEYEATILPKEAFYVGNLLMLPNGRYLPPGVYLCEDGGALVYEPRCLSFDGYLNETHMV